MGKKSLGKKVGIIIFILIFCITNVSYNIKALPTGGPWVTIYKDSDGNLKTSNPSFDTTGKTINEIINYFIDNGNKKIYIENGTYNMWDSIIIDQSDVSIVGESSTDTILKQMTSGAKSIVIQKSNIIVSNLQIDASGGQEAIQAQNHANGGEVHDITIDSCVIIGSRMSTAIRFYGESSSNKNSNNYIQGNKIYSPTGVDAGSSPEGAIVFCWQKDAVIKDNFIEGSMLNVDQCENLEVSNNTIKNSETEGGIRVTLFGNNIKVLKNTIDTTKKSGIAMVAGSASDRYSGIQIMENTITTTQYFGIEVRNLEYAEISNNEISKVYSEGIYLLYSYKVNVAYNRISNFGINTIASGWNPSLTAGIFLDNDVKESVIQNNTIHNDDKYPCPAGIMVHKDVGANKNEIIKNIIVGKFTDGIYANRGTGENTHTDKPSVTTEVTDASIRLNWIPISGITEYEVEVDVGGVVNTYTINDIKYIDGGLPANVVHKYRVRMKYGEWSDEITATNKKPQNITTLSKENSITLNWNKVILDATNEIADYDVYLVDENKIVQVKNDTQYIHSGLSSGTTYRYKVRAENGAWSDEVTAKTKISSPGLSLGSITDNSIEIRWNGVTGATGYYIEVDGSPSLIDVGTSTTYKFTGLSSNASRSYRIKVKDDNIWSNLVTAKTSISSPTLSLGMVTENSIEINWNGVAGATGYYIEVDGSPSLIDVGTSTTHKFIGLSSNTSHSYKIKVKDDNIWSNSVTAVTTKISAPVLSLGAVTESSIELNWNGVAGATGYYIEVDGSTVLIDAGMNTNYKFMGLKSNTTHSYKVKVKDKNVWSNVVTATTLVQQVINPAIVPQTTSSGAQVVIQPEKPISNATTSPAVVPIIPRPPNRPKSSSSGKKKRIEDRTLEFSFESHKTLLYEENIINDKEENKLQKILSYAFKQEYWLNLRSSSRNDLIVSYQLKISLFPYNLFSQNELNNILVNNNETINTTMVRDYTNFKNVNDKSEISEYSIVDKYILSVKDKGISIQRE